MEKCISETLLSVPWGIHLEVSLPNHVTLLSTFEELSHCFPQQLCHVPIPGLCIGLLVSPHLHWSPSVFLIAAILVLVSVRQCEAFPIHLHSGRVCEMPQQNDDRAGGHSWDTVGTRGKASSVSFVILAFTWFHIPQGKRQEWHLLVSPWPKRDLF